MPRLTARRLAALPVDIDTFFRAYLDCALWSSTDDGGAPLDGEYDTDAIPKRVQRAMLRECVDFLEYATDPDNRHAVSPDVLREHGAERCGHDFWLTRNRHGAGFWDRGLGADGDKLTESAHAFGSCDLYVSRRRIYAS